MRFYHQSFSGTYPDGQIELNVYVKDEDSLDAWLAKHSGGRTDEDPQVYYRDVSSKESITAAGREALAFDWEAVTIGTIHQIIFFSGPRVVAIDWFGPDAYQEIFDRMVQSFDD